MAVGDTEAKTTLVFHYVAQSGPDPRAERRTEAGAVPLLSSSDIMHVLRQDGQQHAGPTVPDAANHHSVVFTFHDSVIHPQDPVPFPKALVLGRGAWVHPAHHRPSPAQLLQVEAKTTAFLFAQQTETRPLQALEI